MLSPDHFSEVPFYLVLLAIPQHTRHRPALRPSHLFFLLSGRSSLKPSEAHSLFPSGPCSDITSEKTFLITLPKIWPSCFCHLATDAHCAEAEVTPVPAGSMETETSSVSPPPKLSTWHRQGTQSKILNERTGGRLLLPSSQIFYPASVRTEL